MNILIILLGSHITHLLHNRLDTAIQFINKFNETNVDWFLSGGIKNPDESIVTESEKMAQYIKPFEDLHSNENRENKWSYIYDTIATNTAENFLRVKQFMEQSNKAYDTIYVVTSQFHHKRANKFADAILDADCQWILGGAKCEDCEYWERIHIRNVDADIRKAFNKFIV